MDVSFREFRLCNLGFVAQLSPLAKFRGCGCCAVAVFIQRERGPESGKGRRGGGAGGRRMKLQMRDDVTRIYFHARYNFAGGRPPEEKSLSRRFCNQTDP